MSERAMMSEAGAVGIGTRHARWGATWREAADASEAEARRILAETQACGCAGGWHWSPERGYWQCDGVAEPNILRIGEDPAAALADALAAFVGDAQ